MRQEFLVETLGSHLPHVYSFITLLHTRFALLLARRLCSSFHHSNTPYTTIVTRVVFASAGPSCTIMVESTGLVTVCRSLLLPMFSPDESSVAHTQGPIWPLCSVVRVRPSQSRVGGPHLDRYSASLGF